MLLGGPIDIQVMSSCLRRGPVAFATLFQSPRGSVDMVMIEWLHTMDQGVLGDITVTSSNSGCGITLHALHLGSCARAQEGELLLECTFCASQQLQWHCEGQRQEVLGCI